MRATSRLSSPVLVGAAGDDVLVRAIDARRSRRWRTMPPSSDGRRGAPYRPIGFGHFDDPWIAALRVAGIADLESRRRTSGNADDPIRVARRGARGGATETR
jgi:hypothetical protein